jgi:hypothetical protein
MGVPIYVALPYRSQGLFMPIKKRIKTKHPHVYDCMAPDSDASKAREFIIVFTEKKANKSKKWQVGSLKTICPASRNKVAVTWPNDQDNDPLNLIRGRKRNRLARQNSIKERN